MAITETTWVDPDGVSHRAFLIYTDGNGTQHLIVPHNGYKDGSKVRVSNDWVPYHLTAKQQGLMAEAWCRGSGRIEFNGTPIPNEIEFREWAGKTPSVGQKAKVSLGLLEFLEPTYGALCEEVGSTWP